MISHHHKSIFVHIPKCGGQSIEMAFLQDIGLDWEQRAPLLLRPNANPDLGPPRLAHLLARDYVALGYVPQEMFDAYFTFAVVRNPYRRVVSTYHYLGITMPFTRFLDTHLLDDPANDMKYFVRPQVDFLTDNAGKVLVDKTYRLEEIEDGFADIRTITGLQSDLPHVNASHIQVKAGVRRTLAEALRGRRVAGPKDRHSNWQDYFQTQAIRDKVTTFYRADFETLGYSSGL